MVDMTAVFRECTEEMVDKDSDAWAHRHCVREHVCLSARIRAKAVAWAYKEERQIQPPALNALNDLE